MPAGLLGVVWASCEAARPGVSAGSGASVQLPRKLSASADRTEAPAR
jgi:hypothetical protein